MFNYNITLRFFLVTCLQPTRTDHSTLTDKLLGFFFVSLVIWHITCVTMSCSTAAHYIISCSVHYYSFVVTQYLLYSMYNIAKATQIKYSVSRPIEL